MPLKRMATPPFNTKSFPGTYENVSRSGASSPVLPTTPRMHPPSCRCSITVYRVFFSPSIKVPTSPRTVLDQPSATCCRDDRARLQIMLATEQRPPNSPADPSATSEPTPADAKLAHPIPNIRAAPAPPRNMLLGGPKLSHREVIRQSSPRNFRSSRITSVAVNESSPSMQIASPPN